MNKLTIIGNLTRDPELRTTTSGNDVCTFTVAVNRRRKQNGSQSDADFFRVSAWNETGKMCNQYLSKGKKVCVVGPVSVSLYNLNDPTGTPRAQLEVRADDVEFLTPKNNGYTVVEDEDNPFAG